MQELVTVIGVVIPMLTIAGSAVAFVWKEISAMRNRRREQFFGTIDLITNSRSVITQMTAIYQLRFFPEHRDFILRFCESQRTKIKGSDDSVETLQKEIELSQKALER